MDKDFNAKLIHLVNAYKLTANLSMPAIKRNDYKTVCFLNKKLKNIWENILQFIKNNCSEKTFKIVKDTSVSEFSEDIESIKTIDMYNKILALKYTNIKLKDIKKVIHINNLSIELNPNNEIPYINIAKELLKEKKYKQVSDICERIKTISDTAPVWEILGNTYYAQKDYGKAIESYIQYLELNENDDKGRKKLYKIYQESLSKNRKIYSNKEQEVILIKSFEYLKEHKPALAYGEFVKLYKIRPENIEIQKRVASCLLMLKAYNIILEYFLKTFTPVFKTDKDALRIIASAYFSSQEHYKEAIPLYEDLIKFCPDESELYSRLAFCYERVYQDKLLDKQVCIAEKSIELNPKDNNTITLLARLYYRQGKIKDCEKLLKKMMKNNPIASERVVYGRFLMKEGKITEGYDIYRDRFDTGIVAYPKSLTNEKRWNGIDDLSDSTVLIHYEQGFGDSVMFSRYIPEVAKLAKRVIFVVQKNLIPIFKSSGFDKYCEILSHEADINPHIKLKNTNRSVMYSNGKGMEMIEHNYHIPLMDLPYLMKESPQKMTQAGGYLHVDLDKVKSFRKKYKGKYFNDNGKIKIGLAYHGTKDSVLTYRDIPIKHFLPIIKMKDVECYSFQSDEYAKQLQELDKSVKIIDLGKIFKDFEDTACAMNCMDLIISTDNVIMNLGGALGLRTYGLFNKYTESRWYKTQGDDIGWYKSVRPFQAKTHNDWDNLIKDVKSAIIDEFKISGH